MRKLWLKGFEGYANSEMCKDKEAQRTMKFLEEKPFAAAMKAADVIDRNPEDKDAFEQRRLVKKNELSKYIVKKDQGSFSHAHRWTCKQS
jgi:hypothetical protein